MFVNEEELESSQPNQILQASTRERVNYNLLHNTAISNSGPD